MNVYTPEELDRINKSKETNDRLEEFFKTKREDWNQSIEPLYSVLKIEINGESSKKIMEAQAMCLSYRQMLAEQISIFLDKRAKADVKMKSLRQEKFIWYATGFGIKTNVGEKTLLIDAHVAESQRNIELIENYIEFMRQCNKNLESFQYTIKNIIELLNYLSR
jgi:hypothetical protein